MIDDSICFVHGLNLAKNSINKHLSREVMKKKKKNMPEWAKEGLIEHRWLGRASKSRLGMDPRLGDWL